MKLYKYRQLNEFTFDLIYNNNHYFSKPSNLNDPFECKFELVLSTDKEQIISKLANSFITSDKTKLNQMALAYKSSGSKEGIEVAELMFTDPIKCAEKIYQKGYVENPTALYEGKKKFLLKSIQETYSICCFSKENNSTLMFSHYADNHKGVCLEFDFKETDEWLFKVSYSDKFPIWEDMFIQEKVKDVVRSTILTKSTDWKYENEWRFLEQTDGVKNLSNVCKLSSIIMGCNISYENEQKLKQFCNSQNLEANLYKTILTAGVEKLIENQNELDKSLIQFQKIKLYKAVTTNKYGLELINCG
jgi:Protein of unknown function (DUF2971)